MATVRSIRLMWRRKEFCNNREPSMLYLMSMLCWHHCESGTKFFRIIARIWVWNTLRTRSMMFIWVVSPLCICC